MVGLHGLPALLKMLIVDDKHAARNGILNARTRAAGHLR